MKRWRGWAMVTKCANPQCSESFLYLTLGRLFFVPFTSTSGGSGLGVPGQGNWRHYWLCHKCSQQLTIKPGEGEEIRILPRGEADPIVNRAAASD